MSRLSRAWRVLGHEQRIAGAAALALVVTMLLPWYQQNAVVTAAHEQPLQSRNLDAFQVFSFIEAAVLLVAIAVAYLLFARAEAQRFRLPASDGAMVLIAGLWAGALLVLRLFDKPGVSGRDVAANVGVQWGIFFALAAAGALAYAGSRMRAAQLHPGIDHHPHLRHRRAGEEPAPPAPAPVQTPAPRPATAAGAQRRSAPVRAGRGGEAPTVPAEAPAARARPRYPPAPSQQMSFDDTPREG